MAEGQNAQLFIKLSARYRDTNQIMIYTDCNRIKGLVKSDFKIPIRIQGL